MRLLRQGRCSGSLPSRTKQNGHAGEARRREGPEIRCGSAKLKPRVGVGIGSSAWRTELYPPDEDGVETSEQDGVVVRGASVDGRADSPVSKGTADAGPPVTKCR